MERDVGGAGRSTLPGVTTSELPHLSIRSVEDSLGIVPHLLGFHPHESLVVLMVQDGLVELTARTDLKPLAESGQLELLLGRLWGRFPLADAWFIAYTADQAAAWQVLDRCHDLLSPAVRRRVMHVDGDTFWCDSPQAEPGRHDPRASVLAAEATLLGLPARPSRSELSTLVGGPPDDDVAALIEAFEAAEDQLGSRPAETWPRLMRKAVLASLAAPARLDDDQCARLAVMASDPNARDRALVAMTRGTAEGHLALWTRVTSRCLAGYQVYPLGLMGLAAWLTGNGALQVVCLERAEKLEADAGLVRILGLINENVVPPSAWESLRPKLLAQLRTDVRSGCRRTARRGR